MISAVRDFVAQLDQTILPTCQ